VLADRLRVMASNRDLCDVKFVDRDGVCHAGHQAVLAAVSEPLATYFVAQAAEHLPLQYPEVLTLNLEGPAPSSTAAVEGMLKFVYGTADGAPSQAFVKELLPKAFDIDVVHGALVGSGMSRLSDLQRLGSLCDMVFEVPNGQVSAHQAVAKAAGGGLQRLIEEASAEFRAAADADADPDAPGPLSIILDTSLAACEALADFLYCRRLKQPLDWVTHKSLTGLAATLELPAFAASVAVLAWEAGPTMYSSMQCCTYSHVGQSAWRLSCNVYCSRFVCCECAR
jgi:hypothetical protein